MKFYFVLITSIAILLSAFACQSKAADFKGCTCIRAMEPRLPDGVQKAWGQTSKFWPQKSTLRIRFLSGTEKQKSEAWKRFAKVDALVNLTFVQVTSGPAEIRPRFDKRKGHWSFLGVDSRTAPQSSQTMNLELATGVFGSFSDEWDRVCIHEMLHAIGVCHEHQSPKATGLVWNKSAVYAHYAKTQGWSKQQVDFQVLNRYSGAEFNGTKYDPNSIMQYPIEPGLANIVVGWNTKLSPLDIQFLQSIYKP